MNCSLNTPNEREYKGVSTDGIVHTEVTVAVAWEYIWIIYKW